MKIAINEMSRDVIGRVATVTATDASDASELVTCTGTVIGHVTLPDRGAFFFQGLPNPLEYMRGPDGATFLIEYERPVRSRDWLED